MASGCSAVVEHPPHQLQGHHDLQHNDIQHNIIQHNEIRHKDARHNDIQHNDTQHNGIVVMLSVLSGVNVIKLYGSKL
jgi:hypothetical protein